MKFQPQIVHKPTQWRDPQDEFWVHIDLTENYTIEHYPEDSEKGFK